MKLYEKIIALPDPEVSWSNCKRRPGLPCSPAGQLQDPCAYPLLPCGHAHAPDHGKQDDHPGPNVTPAPCLSHWMNFLSTKSVPGTVLVLGKTAVIKTQ